VSNTFEKAAKSIRLDEAINSAFHLYYRAQHDVSYQMCKTITMIRPDIADIVYLQGLAALRLGWENEGRLHIRHALELSPQIKQLTFLTAALSDTPDLIHAPAAALELHLEEVQKFRATENFILSYPKCGRTWVALVLGSYALNGKDGDPLNLIGITASEPGFSTTEVSHDDIPRTRGFYRPTWNKSVYQDKKVAFLVRNPRDVVVSHYFQHAHRSRYWDSGEAAYTGSISDFIRSEEGSIENVITFYNDWARQRATAARFMLIRYEDLVADPHTQFGRFIEFFEWPDLGADRLAGAIEFGRFENMRELEAQNIFGNPRLLPPEDGNPDGFKTRRGKIGGYTDYLDDEDIAYLDGCIDRTLDELFSFYRATHL
jgi:hypothetical protein